MRRVCGVYRTSSEWPDFREYRREGDDADESLLTPNFKEGVNWDTNKDLLDTISDKVLQDLYVCASVLKTRPISELCYV